MQVSRAWLKNISELRGYALSLMRLLQQNAKVLLIEIIEEIVEGGSGVI